MLTYCPASIRRIFKTLRLLYAMYSLKCIETGDDGIRACS